MEFETNILILVCQAVVTAITGYLILRKKVSAIKKEEAETESTVSETYAKLLEEYRKRSKEEVESIKQLYDERFIHMHQEIDRLNRKIDLLQDELNAQNTIAGKRQADLTEALNAKEYFRGQYTAASNIIEKHLKKTA